MKNSIVAPVYTKSLALIAFNVIVLSYVFTAYQVEIPVQKVADWSIEQLYKVNYLLTLCF
jgi:hypothetical protein